MLHAPFAHLLPCFITNGFGVQTPLAQPPCLATTTTAAFGLTGHTPPRHPPMRPTVTVTLAWRVVLAAETGAAGACFG